MLPISFYYVVLVITGVVAWPHTYGHRGRDRSLWLVVGVVMLLLPLVMPARTGVYYGLTLNTTVFFWAADSHMGPRWGTGSRKWRALVGGTVVALVPLVWWSPMRTWVMVFLVPTLGHLMISGLATPLVSRARSS